jgi:hypothetical protein
VRAWLQFGRAPVIRENRIFDLRFETGLGGNFTAMTLGPEPAASCPPYVTPWEPPRRDLLGPRPQPLATAARTVDPM